MSDMPLSEAVHVLENAANIFTALERVRGIVASAAMLEQAIGEKQAQVASLESQISGLKAEALALAQRGVEDQRRHEGQLAAAQAEIKEASQRLNILRDEHATRRKAQDAEFAEVQTALRREHAKQEAALRDQIDGLKAERDAISAEVERLKAKFAS